MTPAIVYARWSPRPNAEDCLSIETQLDRCRNYCQGNEYEIVQEYQEPNVSGDDCRPELEKVIGHAQRLRAVLVVYKLDRAARNTQDTLRIVRQLREAKADIASVTEQINTRGWMGKISLLYWVCSRKWRRSASGRGRPTPCRITRPRAPDGKNGPVPVWEDA